MRLTRYMMSGKACWGVEQGDMVLALAENGDAGSPSLHAKSDIVLLPPCAPRQIVCVALNYRSVAEALGVPAPAEPVFFFKSLGSIARSGDAIRLPGVSNDVVEEAELAIVLGRDVLRVDVETANAAIGGYAIANDVTARDIQTRGGSYLWATVSKSFETFFPVGPHVETELLDLPDRRLECRINGKVNQSALLGDLIFPPAELISRLSHVTPLYRGDVIATGTPLGYGPIAEGDTIEISIEGLAPLVNTVRRDGAST
jgi:2-keto-4-pentenoate hydratase/2-oxohepta-3-ene-1,7-dioic acid hydratase in catechol pathway